MAIFTNQTKHNATYSQQAFGSASLTWDQANFSWDTASGTWSDPFAYSTQTKHATSFVNVTKD